MEKLMAFDINFIPWTLLVVLLIVVTMLVIVSRQRQKEAKSLQDKLEEKCKGLISDLDSLQKEKEQLLLQVKELTTKFRNASEGLLNSKNELSSYKERFEVEKEDLLIKHADLIKRIECLQSELKENAVHLKKEENRLTKIEQEKVNLQDKLNQLALTNEEMEKRLDEVVDKKYYYINKLNSLKIKLLDSYGGENVEYFRVTINKAIESIKEIISKIGDL